MSAPLWSLVWLALLFFAWRRLMLYLHVFQQEEYDPPRFLAWIVRTKSYDRRLTLGIAMLAVLGLFLPALNYWADAVVAGLMLSSAWRERNHLKTAKKKLAMTARAKRIFAVALVYAAGIGLAFALWSPLTIWWILPVQLMPLTLALAVWTLAPQEKLIQQRYWREAHEKLARLAPRVVGITGSFGKTSAKHVLAHIMDTASTGLATPGSINTPMGIARVVREQLRPEHRHFIAEMGAYGPGSIERLCRLTPPDLAIVTAIGKAHYERFKSLDTVAAAKFELAEAAVARGGKVVMPEEILEFGPVADFAERHPDALVLCGRGERCALRIVSERETADGLALTVRWNEETHDLKVPLHGRHQTGNVALCFAAACFLGIAPETVALALASTPQITHRLEVKRRPDGATIVDDAYNSNPVGFASALETLDHLVGEGGRRILATPGMVELGEAHDEEHARIGTLAAQHVDVLLPILPERIQSFITAFENEREDAEVVRCETFAAADAWISENARAGDVVLLENDLPDLYERPLKL